MTTRQVRIARKKISRPGYFKRRMEHFSFLAELWRKIALRVVHDESAHKYADYSFWKAMHRSAWYEDKINQR